VCSEATSLGYSPLSSALPLLFLNHFSTYVSSTMQNETQKKCYTTAGPPPPPLSSTLSPPPLVVLAASLPMPDNTDNKKGREASRGSAEAGKEGQSRGER
jgi:hypothetical protein